MRIFSENRHEFDVNIDGDRDNIALTYSSSPYWTKPGEETATLQDDGNGYKIDIDGSLYEFDYDTAFKMLMLLLLSNDCDYKIVKEVIVAQCL